MYWFGFRHFYLGVAYFTLTTMTTAKAQEAIALQPIIASMQSENMKPLIIGGKPTISYKNVVAILLDRHDGAPARMHCSGTVIARHTILTAAHCVKDGNIDYRPAIKSGRMSYILGTLRESPGHGPVEIVEATFPDEYDPIKYIHDVAVMYTSSKKEELIPAQPAVLHQSLPDWSAIINKENLTFVGWGLADPNVGYSLGVKREANWGIISADVWTVQYPGGNTGTCYADSGGPAFYTKGTSLVLMGITSKGDPYCRTGGADTRVDSHYAWITKNLEPKKTP
jgi:hypothetical protein